MLPKSTFFRVIGVLSLCLVMSVFAFADTIRLKDGSIIKGKIVSFGGGKFVVVIGDGSRQRELSFEADEIERIEFDKLSNQVSIVKTTDNRAYEKNPPTITNNGNDTVITVGNGNQNQASVTSNDTDEPAVENSPAPVVNTKPRPENIKPIQVNVRVLADNTSNGWSNSGFVVKKGQKIKVTANGRVSLGNGRYTSPNGIASLPDADKLMKSDPTGALIAVIGDDNNDFILVGQTREFTATRDGALFLGVNEGNLNDNSGVFDVTVEIDPGK